MQNLYRFVIVALVFAPALRAGPGDRPFQWNRELRQGALLSERDFPATFRAPVDMVYRIWKESGGWRLEARSYRRDILVVTMATLVNRRGASPDAMRAELVRECASEPRPLVAGDTSMGASTRSSIDLECLLAGGEPARLAQLRLVPLPSEGAHGDGSAPQGLLFVMAIALPSDRRLLQMLEIRPSRNRDASP